jgi:hypothetical protein
LNSVVASSLTVAAALLYYQFCIAESDQVHRFTTQTTYLEPFFCVPFQKQALTLQQDGSKTVSLRNRRSRFSVAVTAASAAVESNAANGRKSCDVNVGEGDLKKMMKLLDDTSKLNQVTIPIPAFFLQFFRF